MFEHLMCTFGYLKTLDIILSLLSLQKLDWTRTFDTHCTLHVHNLYSNWLSIRMSKKETELYKFFTLTYFVYINSLA